MFKKLEDKLNALYESAEETEVDETEEDEVDTPDDENEIDPMPPYYNLKPLTIYEELENDFGGEKAIALAQIAMHESINKDNLLHLAEIFDNRERQLFILKEDTHELIKEDNLDYLKDKNKNSFFNKLITSITNVTKIINQSYSGIISGFNRKFNTYNSIANSLSKKIKDSDIESKNCVVTKIDLKKIVDVTAFSKLTDYINEIIPEVNDEKDMVSAINAFNGKDLTSAKIYQYIIGKLLNDSFDGLAHPVIAENIEKQFAVEEDVNMNANNVNVMIDSLREITSYCKSVADRKSNGLTTVKFDALQQNIKVNLKYSKGENEQVIHLYYSDLYKVYKEAHRAVIDIYAAIGRLIDKSCKSYVSAIKSVLK